MSDFELVCESTKSPKCVGEVGTDFIAAAWRKIEFKKLIEAGRTNNNNYYQPLVLEWSIFIIINFVHWQ